ncbi:MAG: family 43 glycosylhydrolase [Clostridium sp.]|nr:family 43 glycosylhydrolase [Clostridium sp.]
MNRSIIAGIALLTAATSAAADNIPNPILENVADIGVLKYNGKYYLGGCRTDGDFYISSDLVNWEGPVHVIDMDNEWSAGSGCGNNQIHANDMLYDNGTIHAYWSVNYWGNDRHAVHVVHSEASDPMGPYKEPVRDRWMDNRIDPKVFRDDDGSLYMYMVRFTDGNTIWARRMKDWREFVDDDEPDAFVCQFASSPNTWERMDNAVAEGPWVIKYHGNYYMMYNANHTGGEWGNYQLGVAQATSPMGFNNANKYNHPVVLSNQKEIEDNSVDLLRFDGDKYSPLFRYSTTGDATPGWTAPGFDDSAWKKGAGGFARRTERGSSTYPLGTFWNSDTIRLRKQFSVKDPSANLALRLTSRGATRVWLNGSEIWSSPNGVYQIVNLTPEMRRSLAAGENTLAVESTGQGRRGGYLNVELFDTGDRQADPVIVWTPGQPNILRGPNGLEWWLVYMANNDGRARSQYVDRVHFHGDKLVVDGITHAANSGFHPAPAAPAYGDRFDNADGLRNWNITGGTPWSVSDGALRCSAAADATLSPELASASYLWEVNLVPNATAGIYAAWIDPANNISVVFDRRKSAWDVVERVGGRERIIASTPLRPDFRWDVFHQLRVERDHADMVVSVDEMRIATPFETSISAAAVPGVFAQGPAEFDGVIYTIGFDDGNDRMNGWNVAQGALLPTTKGATAAGATRAFKGTPSRNYELTTQVSALGKDAVAGFYPLWVDDKNHIKATIDAPRRSVVLSTVRKGKTTDTKVIPLDRMRTLYTDTRFTDSFDKGYTMDCPTEFDAIWLKRYDVANRNIFSDNRFDKETETVGENVVFHDNVFSLVEPAVVAGDGSWKTIDTAGATIASNPMYNAVSFEPLTARRMRLVNTAPTDGAYHVYDIRIHELFKDSYNLRALRDGNDMHLFVDGEEIATMPVGDFGPSTIGLVSEQGSPEFHGLTYFHR